jgi:hypothetical protein
VLSNNGGQVVSNQGAALKLLSVEDATVPLPGVEVELCDAQGKPLSEEHPVTDAEGRYRFRRVGASGPLVYVRAAFTVDGHACTIEAAAPAPREAVEVQVPLNPATTLVAKKVAALVEMQAADEAVATSLALEKLSQAVGKDMTEREIAAALLQPPAQAARTFDQLLVARPELKAALAASAAREDDADDEDVDDDEEDEKKASFASSMLEALLKQTPDKPKASPTPGKSAQPAAKPSQRPDDDDEDDEDDDDKSSWWSSYKPSPRASTQTYPGNLPNIFPSPKATTSLKPSATPTPRATSTPRPTPTPKGSSRSAGKDDD